MSGYNNIPVSCFLDQETSNSNSLRITTTLKYVHVPTVRVASSRVSSSMSQNTEQAGELQLLKEITRCFARRAMGTAGAAVVLMFTSLYYSSVGDTLKSMTQMWLALRPAWFEYLVLRHYI